MQIIILTIETLWYIFLLFMEKVPIGKSTNMVLFPKEKVLYSTWYFFPLVLFPIHPLASLQAMAKLRVLEMLEQDMELQRLGKEKKKSEYWYQ